MLQPLGCSTVEHLELFPGKDRVSIQVDLFELVNECGEGTFDGFLVLDQTLHSNSVCSRVLHLIEESFQSLFRHLRLFRGALAARTWRAGFDIQDSQQKSANVLARNDAVLRKSAVALEQDGALLLNEGLVVDDVLDLNASTVVWVQLLDNAPDGGVIQLDRRQSFWFDLSTSSIWLGGGPAAIGRRGGRGARPCSFHEGRVRSGDRLRGDPLHVLPPLKRPSDRWAGGASSSSSSGGRRVAKASFFCRCVQQRRTPI
mmetsp:Transcript_59262/g.125600  ORF Transcript_59262/g.125600 Transcript_59262/m.125600 type:complete len:258 (-) Transcript_59262:95-868(-)